MSSLYIVATPIGNLEDISSRALKVLQDVDVVFAEDTREAGKLLSHFNISSRIERYDEHSHDSQLKRAISYLNDGKDVAYVSDAGTPCISDPGKRLVRGVRESGDFDVNIIPIPGASAITTLLSVSGLDADAFTFFGFIPHKKGRETLFTKISESDMTVVFYESPHRIQKTLTSLGEHLDEGRVVVVGRELTKMFEEVISGNIGEVKAYYEKNSDKVRGEFVVAIGA